MNFVKFESKKSAFAQVITMSAFAAAIKLAESVATVHFSNVLGTDEAKYVICTLPNGTSCTFPVSKKATIGSTVASMYAAESHDGTWVICTTANEGTTF